MDALLLSHNTQRIHACWRYDANPDSHPPARHRSASSNLTLDRPKMMAIKPTNASETLALKLRPKNINMPPRTEMGFEQVSTN